MHSISGRDITWKKIKRRWIMKCFIVMFPGGTFEKYTDASAPRGKIGP